MMNLEIMAAVQSTAIHHGVGVAKISGHEVICRNVKGRPKGSRGGFSFRWYCDGKRIAANKLTMLLGDA